MPFSMSGNNPLGYSYNRFDKFEAQYNKEEETKQEEETLEEGSCNTKGYQEGGEVKCDKCEGKGCKACGSKSEKKGAKPDYLDFDGDGNKEEPMKDALKSKKEVKEEALEEGSCNTKGYQEGGEIRYPTGKKQSFTKDKTDPKVAAGRKAAKEMGLLKKEELEATGVFTAEEIEALLGKS